MLLGNPCNFLFFSGPVRSNDGGLSNFAYFDNCTFEGNTAEEFGAAIGMIGLLSFVSSEAIRPMEITDWYANAVPPEIASK